MCVCVCERETETETETEMHAIHTHTRIHTQVMSVRVWNDDGGALFADLKTQVQVLTDSSTAAYFCTYMYMHVCTCMCMGSTSI